jgi:hypothetical protein
MHDQLSAHEWDAIMSAEARDTLARTREVIA